MHVRELFHDVTQRPGDVFQRLSQILAPVGGDENGAHPVRAAPTGVGARHFFQRVNDGVTGQIDF